MCMPHVYCEFCYSSQIDRKIIVCDRDRVYPIQRNAENEMLTRRKTDHDQVLRIHISTTAA